MNTIFAHANLLRFLSARDPFCTFLSLLHLKSLSGVGESRLFLRVRDEHAPDRTHKVRVVRCRLYLFVLNVCFV